MKKILVAFLYVLLGNSMSAQHTPWYHNTSIYQIYPRSFFDSNADGIGDIPGIIEKLDYIRSMGYDAVWFSPFYSSPQRDFGYDISDYQNIAPEYGSMQDAEQLISEVHARGMKVIFDMVMNHTSDEHAWFKESSSSKNNAKADWYIWRDKPTRWQSLIMGSGWHYCEARQQYYWASFLPFQPDLNYRNSDVKKAMFDVVRFWLDKGVDGFRLDIFNSVYKDAQFRSSTTVRHELRKAGWEKDYVRSVKAYLNLPESIEFAKELRAVCDNYGDKILLGEIYGNHAVVKKYLGKNKNDGLGLVFNFEMLRFRFNAKYFHGLVTSLEENFPNPYSPVYVFSNHDRRRSMTRLKGNTAKARLLHMFQLTVRGVPCMYYGEELGMSDGRIPYKKGLDPIARKYKWVARFLTDWADETLNRDDVRTPMQWNASSNAGFTKATTTWLPVNGNYTEVNVETLEQDSNSLISKVKALLNLRKSNLPLNCGTLALVAPDVLPKGVLGYKRKNGNDELLVLLNFSKKEVVINDLQNSKVLFSLTPSDVKEQSSVKLGAYGGIILKL
ncbi:MAG: alpha-amylase [Chitinophagales bacterium]|nr:alpha-amylase [Chitinophagales bacterium]